LSMKSNDWKQLAKNELNLAENARNLGNEGRARVCARRAAGYVTGEYLQRKNIEIHSESALQRLKYLESTADLSSIEKETLHHFLIHTTPEHKLPIDADLIVDVHLLTRLLLGESLD
jgi:hypothetical protein